MSAGNEPEWKARFRAPRILGMQVAAGAPTRGIVTSNVSGTFQLHAWDVLGGRLRALTRRPTGIGSGVLGPDGRFVYYHDDADGNEIGHFVRIPFEGGAPVSITPGLPPYPTFGLAVSGAGNRLGFVTASEGSYHLHVIHVDAGGTLGPPQRIHSCSRLLVGPVFSHDGAIAVVAVSAGAGSFQFGLVALDTATGRTVAELADADSRLGAVAFAPLSGDARLVAWSNRTGVSRPLVWNVVRGTRADIASDGLEGEIYPADWSPDSTQVLLVQFVRAVQRLHVYDVMKGTSTPLNHPTGTYGHAYFGLDGTIHVLWEDSTHTPQVIALDAATGVPARTLLPGADIAPCRPWRSVSFASTDGQQIQGWLATPAGDGPFPTILHLHGGPEFAMTEVFGPASQAWLDHGFAFLSINYRGSTTFGRAFLEQIWGNVGRLGVEDMVAARGWLVKGGYHRPGTGLRDGLVLRRLPHVAGARDEARSVGGRYGRHRRRRLGHRP